MHRIVLVHEAVIGPGELGEDAAAQGLDEVIIELLEDGQVQNFLVEIIVYLSLQMLRILQMDFGVQTPVEEPLGL